MQVNFIMIAMIGGLMTLLGVAMVLFAVIAIAALLRRRAAGIVSLKH